MALNLPDLFDRIPRAAQPRANRVAVADAPMPIDIMSQISPSLSCADIAAYDFMLLKAAEDKPLG